MYEEPNAVTVSSLYFPACAYLHMHICKCFSMSYISLLQFDGPKPLHIAALMGSVDIMKILINECGCKADLRNEVCSKSHLIMTCTYIVCYGNVNHEQKDSWVYTCSMFGTLTAIFIFIFLGEIFAFSWCNHNPQNSILYP